MSKGLKDCTFTPRINKYRGKSRRKSKTPGKKSYKVDGNEMENHEFSNENRDTDLNKQEVRKIKNLIRK